MSRKRTNTVRLVAPAGVGLAVNGFDAHLRHQRPDVLTPNFHAFKLEACAHRQRDVPDVTRPFAASIEDRYQASAAARHRLTNGTDRVTGKSCVLSIIVLRSHRRCDRARRPKNQSPAPAGRSFRSGVAACFSAAVVKTPEVFSSYGVFH
jgi:hypothetical protein